MVDPAPPPWAFEAYQLVKGWVEGQLRYCINYYWAILQLPSMGCTLLQTGNGKVAVVARLLRHDSPFHHPNQLHHWT